MIWGSIWLTYEMEWNKSITDDGAALTTDVDGSMPEFQPQDIVNIYCYLTGLFLG